MSGLTELQAGLTETDIVGSSGGPFIPVADYATDLEAQQQTVTQKVIQPSNLAAIGLLHNFANILVVDSGGKALNAYTELSTAMAAASSGDLIVITTDTTETGNTTWIDGVNVFCFPGRTVDLNGFTIVLSGAIAGQWDGGAVFKTGGRTELLAIDDGAAFSILNSSWNTSGAGSLIEIQSGAACTLLVRNSRIDGGLGNMMPINGSNAHTISVYNSECVADSLPVFNLQDDGEHILKIYDSLVLSPGGNGIGIRITDDTSINQAVSEFVNCKIEGAGTGRAIFVATPTISDFPVTHSELTNGVYGIAFAEGNNSNTVDGVTFGGGNTLITLTPLSNEPPTSNNATLDTRNAHPVLDFDDTTNESAVFSAVMPRHYSGLGLVVYIHFAMTSAVVGDVDWDVSFERIGDQQQDLDVDGFAAVQSVNNTTVPGTSGLVDIVSVAFTDGAQMDSIAIGEGFRVKVTRDAASDTAVGDAELVFLEIKEDV